VTFSKNYKLLILSSAIFLNANFVLAANKSVITNTFINSINNTLTVIWNQLEPVSECFVELTGADPNSFYSPPEDPVPCNTIGQKTKTITLSRVSGIAPLYTVIIDNITSDVISDYVLVRESLPGTGTSGGGISPLPPPAPAPAPVPLPQPLPPPAAEKKLQPPAKQRIILRNLSSGQTGEDVSLLQEFLKSENVYPEGFVTGYFGDLTRQAVIRFQEKYANEILTPLGLVSGTGYAGPATLKKINAILETSGLFLPDSGSAPSSVFYRDLYEGTAGDDVEKLQLFLQDQGFLPPGLLTFALNEPYRQFGLSTKTAVMVFQEKYRDEILVPAGLASGSGYVGPLTRAKIEALLQSGKKQAP